jgi:hypothetical protein
VFKEGIAKFLKLDSLMENLTGYVETRIELTKYEVKEDLARILSKASVMIAILLTGMFFLLIFSLGVAIKLGQEVGYFFGFAIVSLLYAIGAGILFYNRDVLGRKVELKIKEVIKQKKK